MNSLSVSHGSKSSASSANLGLMLRAHATDTAKHAINLLWLGAGTKERLITIPSPKGFAKISEPFFLSWKAVYSRQRTKEC